MNKPEWIPVDPCDTCTLMGKDNRCNALGRTCTSELIYKREVDIQEKLLNWLLENHYLGHSLIDPMLKQLKEAK